MWDFAGQTEYYVTHNMFLNAENAVFLLVIKITDLKDGKMIPPRKMLQIQMEEVSELDLTLFSDVSIVLITITHYSIIWKTTRVYNF